MNTTKMETLMKDREMDELLALEPVPVDIARVKKLTARRLRAQRRQSAPVRPRFRLLAVACVAGILFMGTAAYAVGSLIVGANPFDFLYQSHDDLYSAHVTDKALPIYGRELPNLELFNTPVGQTVQSDGVAVTLDAVAIDDNFVKVFLTYRYDEPVDLTTVVAPGYAGSDAIRTFTAQPTIALNDLELNGADHQAKDSSAYFEGNDPHIIKKAVQYLIPTTLPDELTLTVTLTPFTDDHVLVPAVPEPLSFTVALDKSAASAYTTALEPGTHEFTIEGETWTLDLRKFAVTPFGVVAVVDNHGVDPFAAVTDGQTRYLGLRDFVLIDQDDTEWRLIAPAQAQNGTIEAGFVAGLSADVSSLRIAPVTFVVRNDAQRYNVADIGARMEVDSRNGFWLRDYRVEGNSVTFVAEPFGDRPLANDNGVAGYQFADGGVAAIDFVIDWENVDTAVSYGEPVECSYDAASNLYTYTYFFDAAMEDSMLRQIDSFHLTCSRFSSRTGRESYDATQALTLELPAS